ncbi:MAG: UvrD-helicase domain-containing protein, partial [Thermodesulfobacteriota bacterium]|nr:UvrD-helicase domain-containing protein [Thermodesulfobacteriota bacterium]
NITSLAAWSRIKGVHVIGTGDFTHPAWFQQLKDTLQPAEPGFFRLQDSIKPDFSTLLHPELKTEEIPTRFVLTAEISSIYKRGGKVRKVHNILIVPDFLSAEKINSTLASIGNIESDGRPILGLDSRDLLEILLEKAPDGFLVPAHIWTPWFSLFGSKSGFDRLEDCYGDLSEHIFALETGLSSDPEMNRLISALDRYTLISNSDCHSPGKLCREANVFDTGFDYYSMKEAIKNPCDKQGKQHFSATIEFYPEEGKYHHDGHRKCSFCCDPYKSRELSERCPECGKPMTIGVLSRVVDLADRRTAVYPKGSPDVLSLIPLTEILSEIVGVGPNSKTVMAHYFKCVERFGSELNIITKTPVKELATGYSTLLAEAVSRVRQNQVIRKPGYDGEFGVISVFEKGEKESLAGQNEIFVRKARKPKATGKKRKIKKRDTQQAITNTGTEPDKKKDANPEQKNVILHAPGHILVQAGPGTGKTFTLIQRIAHLLAQNPESALQMVCISFTNKAADELHARLKKQCGEAGSNIRVSTFHSFCLYWLRKENSKLQVVVDDERIYFLKRLFPALNRQDQASLQQSIHDFLSSKAPRLDNPQVEQYLELLNSNQRIDINGVTRAFLEEILTGGKRVEIQQSVSELFVDEFQDLNFLQYEVIRECAGFANIFAIGDPDQSIYGFRGSRPEFFYAFPEEFPCTVAGLTENYRSPQSVLQAAMAVIQNNPAPLPRVELGANQHSSLPIVHHVSATEKQEAIFVGSMIEQLVGGTSHRNIEKASSNHATEVAFSDIAVLYRSAAVTGQLISLLEKKALPFQVVGNKPFYMKGDVAPLYYLICCAAGSSQVSDYLHYLNFQPGIGKTSLERIEQGLPYDCDTSHFWDIAQELLPAKGAKILNVIQQKIVVFSKQVEKEGITASLKKYIGTENQDQEQISRFITLASVFGADLSGFAKYLQDNSKATLYDERAEKVTLMSVHASKGLEFPVVIIMGLEDGIFPSGRASDTLGMEEERRLFYVGMTRAKEQLILSRSVSRVVFGRKTLPDPSRFIGEIPGNLLKVTTVKAKKVKRKKSAGKQLSLF